MALLIFIVGIILFISLIVVHEFGHFIVARRNGVDAEEFAIFFGPTIYSRETKNGWTFRFNVLPLGGYVKLKGEHDSDTEKGSYGAASLWVKTKIMAAGVFANLIAGLVMLTILALIGMPQIIPNQFSVKSNAHQVKQASTVVDVGSVLAGSPAAKTGLKAGDDITYIGPAGNLTKITSVSVLQATTKKYAGQKVLIDYSSSGKTYQTSTTLNSSAYVNTAVGNNRVYLGVALGSYSNGVSLLRYTWAAPVVAVGLTKQIVVLSYQGLSHALRGLGGIVAGTATNNTSARRHAQTTASNQVVGPYGIYVILKDGSALGFQFMLFIIALISLTLAIINILPIPALDGGRLWLTLISRAFKHPMTAKTEELVNAVGMVVLMLLVGIVTYVDINRFH